MPLSLKQIEAVYWVHVLESYQEAAERLYATQSTISKRVLELEATLGVVLFEPKNRTRLTHSGKEVLSDFKRMLELQRDIMLRIKDEKAYKGRFRIGVTEMVALSWLPAFTGAIQAEYPQLHLEFVVNFASSLWEQMINHRLDLIVCVPPDLGVEPYLVDSLCLLDLVWVCKPGLFGKNQRSITLEALLAQPLLTYAKGSWLHRRMMDAVQRVNGRTPEIIACNSMIALAELARAGLGVTCLPRLYFQHYFDTGSLSIVDCDHKTLQSLDYAVVHRGDAVSVRIVECARRTYDFRRMP